MTRPTEILRLDGLTDDDLVKQWIAYVASLGVDPERVRDRLVIMHDDAGYHLHLSLKTLAPCGAVGLLDLATNDVVSTPLVIDLGHEQNWPPTPTHPRTLRGFDRALVACRLGDKISRSGWNASGQYVVFQRGYPDGIPINSNTSQATGIPEGTARRSAGRAGLKANGCSISRPARI